MLAILDKAAAVLVVMVGVVHIGVGYTVFVAPTERGVWFVSAGFLLVTTGLANLASAQSTSRSQAAAAASGSLAVLILGALIASANPALLFSPQTLVLLALGIGLTGFRLRQLLAHSGGGPAE